MILFLCLQCLLLPYCVSAALISKVTLPANYSISFDITIPYQYTLSKTAVKIYSYENEASGFRSGIRESILN